ncbi:MAG: hypothetical protein A2998_02095 [Candidatus Staskawiczbacteria bacterium RIFCSPLOWO2_01_FULL_37_25b]|uniref:Uncharacterized protein n=2 Tax=Candidatus Staskawicziibacteriota TaxID=1817916 RepID=A0A1G2HSA2_9BACT|nr:MAG: hypothetical protein A2812_00200 [Candidatus Staskawiczbacteria bacterium RIFCSPHIGHO2_01_FULL_36_16]OGZ74265.1 MAG: hypothetical protein A2998_02095 [Candidatus Staskawiczbacteria bacterium RIFCSPLOWO2_01_FULL_37_25b]
MKKLILWIMIIIGIIIVTGGVAVFAKDAEIFDIFFSDKVKDERALNRMAKLYPEIMGDYVLYSWNAEKVQKRAECEGEICSRYTIGQYRMDGSNKVVFVHIYKATKGTEIFKNVLLNMLSSEKFGEYNVIRPERHEIGWWVGSNVDYILTQEGTVKFEIDGGQSMSYINKATGENPVTQYFISKYPPAK